MTKDPASRREDVVGRPRNRDRTLAVRERTLGCGKDVEPLLELETYGLLGKRDDISAKRTKDLKALGRFITKEFEEGLSGNGRTRVGLMTRAPLGDSALLIQQLRFHRTGTIGLKAKGGGEMT